MIIDQLFTPKPLQEGGPYDLPGKDYARPGDTPRKRPSGEHNPYPYSKEEDDDHFREIFRKKREAAAKASGHKSLSEALELYFGKNSKPISEGNRNNQLRLMEETTFRNGYAFARLLVEKNLTKDQVLQLFKDVEQGATAAGGNRTGLGKAKEEQREKRGEKGRRGEKRGEERRTHLEGLDRRVTARGSPHADEVEKHLPLRQVQLRQRRHVHRQQPPHAGRHLARHLNEKAICHGRVGTSRGRDAALEARVLGRDEQAAEEGQQRR
jgi:hypothetical protein